MRVKNIVGLETLENHKFEDYSDLDMKDRKKEKIRNGLKTVGKISLKSMMVLGGIAGFAMPLISSGAVASKVAFALASTAAAGKILEICANAGEVFNESKKLGNNAMQEAEMGA